MEYVNHLLTESFGECLAQDGLDAIRQDSELETLAVFYESLCLCSDVLYLERLDRLGLSEGSEAPQLARRRVLALRDHILENPTLRADMESAAQALLRALSSV